MEKIIINIISSGFIAGFFLRFIPSRVKYIKEIIAILVSLFFLYYSLTIYSINFVSQFFFIDTLSSFISIFISLFTFLTLIYGLSYLKDFENSNRYYAYILWTLSSSIGAVFSNNLIIFAVFWGFLAITLYLLLNIFDPENSYPCKKDDDYSWRK
jgi:NADH:ubiquinone oxidoreductase subunit 5 (subunit L)/multisubunit Na+/H+ antiporter MnhA subunit